MRLYRAQGFQVKRSEALEHIGASGWAIDKVKCIEPKALRLEHEDLWLELRASPGCSVELKVLWLPIHPEIPDEGPPECILQLAKSEDIGWIEVYKLAR